MTNEGWTSVDPSLIAVIVIVPLAILAGVLLWKRRQRRRLLGELALLPARVVNPRLFSNLRRIRVWQLEVEQPTKACAWARDAKGLRFRADASVPLPVAGCSKQCRCRYEAIVENRRHKRRTDPIDQPELNLGETGGDRRHSRGRRKEDQWQGTQR